MRVGRLHILPWSRKKAKIKILNLSNYLFFFSTQNGPKTLNVYHHSKNYFFNFIKQYTLILSFLLTVTERK